mmetsp:Transcript_79868/g.229263  ORF Transcript_79868/g.229263 Transcript_79868/m.229263 type:complete len:250 (+) Transcript_79868:745-1494(+)
MRRWMACCCSLRKDRKRLLYQRKFARFRGGRDITSDRNRRSPFRWNSSMPTFFASSAMKGCCPATAPCPSSALMQRPITSAASPSRCARKKSPQRLPIKIKSMVRGTITGEPANDAKAGGQDANQYANNLRAATSAAAGLAGPSGTPLPNSPEGSSSSGEDSKQRRAQPEKAIRNKSKQNSAGSSPPWKAMRIEGSARCTLVFPKSIASSRWKANQRGCGSGRPLAAFSKMATTWRIAGTSSPGSEGSI